MITTNRKMPTALFILFNLIAIIISFSRIIEIKGILSIVLWGTVLAADIIFIIKKCCDKRKLKAAVIFCMVVYVLSGLLFAVREYSSARTVRGEFTNGREYTVSYELNPGAMSHISYERRVYFNIVDTKLLTIIYLEKSEFYKSYG